MKGIIPNISSFDISFKKYYEFISFNQIKSSFVCQFITCFDYIRRNLIRG